ncbi:MAG: M48 family metallopeptidase [Spirochaetales bacterium]|nr:M48 family metallopeptidase [Spirochaetales bacterium]
MNRLKSVSHLLSASTDIDLSLLSGYPDDVLIKVGSLIEQKKLGSYIEDRYPEKHHIITNKALFAYIQDLKRTFMKKASPVHKVLYDDSIETAYNALGLHSFVSRIQGNKLKSKSEIRIASIFKKAPADFLYMIAVHELAHLKEKEHNKTFYRLCHNMLSDYSQMEFDLRLYLIHLAG